ncbi:PilZ domain-containing protein [Methylobacterium trifolii]|uniref:PilZ domain-containing protein n=1 Tax=Methylobacterium trifolii TaxID=1003092 RepID=A0ABQ4UA65_9HYPH|nr:PilZ domain-containing protein [Methylobacterium trifolii]GJE62645.1 hypothetical protein MPOCJGCO_4778 [Methylobacterium trifolii]
MKERRETARRRACLGATIRVAAFLPERGCYLRNLSLDGAKLVVPEAVTLPPVFDLVVTSRQETRRARLVWRRGGEAGIRFEPEASCPTRADDEAARQREVFAAAEPSPTGRLH